MSSDSTCAAAPFDHEKADVILRSSDNIDFHVFKIFLSLASSFFETMFSIPQPAQASMDHLQETKDGLIVVPVAEDSKTLDILLRFCYPRTLADNPNIETVKDAVDVLEAAMKYSLDVIEKKVYQVFLNPKILEAEPLRCFAVVHRGRLREETLLAAKYTLTQPLIPPSFEEIDLIDARGLLSLLAYHRKCGDAVFALRLDLSWITSHYGSSQACSWLSGQWQQTQPTRSAKIPHSSYTVQNNDCSCTRVTNGTYSLFNMKSLEWWENFIEETFLALREKPCKATVQASSEKTVQAVKMRDCKACSPKVTEGMRDFVDLFVKKIEEAVAQIELELRF